MCVKCECTSFYNTKRVIGSLVPGTERLVSTVCACVAHMVFLGNLETTVYYTTVYYTTIVRVPQPYFTESWESLHLHVQDTTKSCRTPLVR